MAVSFAADGAVGYITLESAKVATPSVAKTLSNLRATPHMSIGREWSEAAPATVKVPRAELLRASNLPQLGGHEARRAMSI